MIATSPLHTDAEIDDLIHNIDVAARVALEKISAEAVALRKVAPVDQRKFDSVEHEPPRPRRSPSLREESAQWRRHTGPRRVVWSSSTRMMSA
jgi:hypothetical protein